jgi:thiol-disulfide isomerase/thioredoxin
MVLAAIALAAGCGGKKVKTVSDSPHTRQFPMVSVPSVSTSDQSNLEFVAEHYWDRYLDPASKGWLCDSNFTAGVQNDELEKNVGNYTTVIGMIPLAEAQKDVDNFFTQIENYQRADSSSNVFSKLTALISRYLYDPNSPVRSEDLYLPFVKRLSESEFVPSELRGAFAYDAKMCSINQIGTPAADFTFTELNGRRRSLYSIKAEWTLLFFSNPGCPSCKHIIEALSADSHVQDMISSGKLAVVNVYIDQDIDEWKSYAKNYPSSWHSGYDQTYSIRSGQTYNVRAIPSLYILDSEKKVQMKDAPEDKILLALSQL